MEQFNRTEFENDSEVFLENFNIYELFRNLTQQLVVHKPENPLHFMINYLENPQGKKAFIIG